MGFVSFEKRCFCIVFHPSSVLTFQRCFKTYSNSEITKNGAKNAKFEFKVGKISQNPLSFVKVLLYIVYISTTLLAVLKNMVFTTPIPKIITYTSSSYKKLVVCN